jgi:glycosyltransferase involved in cell wall biosynthesis
VTGSTAPPAGTSLIHVILPGPRATPTGGFVYDSRVIDGLAARGRLGSVVELPDRFPNPDAATIDLARRAFATLPDGALVVVDGLALSPLGPLVARERRRLAIVALVHHPLGDETGIGAERRRHFFRDEAAALAHVRHVIVPSRTTAARLQDFGVAPDRLSVVTPGVDGTPGTGRSIGRRNSQADRALRLLAVGSLVPRKGYDRLLAALARIRDRPWRLDVAGQHRDRRHATRLRALTQGLGLARRVTWHGAVDALALDRLYRGADLFVLASRHEGFGIVLVEAAAYGLPSLAGRAGAVAEAAAHGGTFLVPANDRRAFTDALQRLVTDKNARNRLSMRAHAARSSGRTWDAACDDFIVAIDGACRP